VVVGISAETVESAKEETQQNRGMQLSGSGLLRGKSAPQGTCCDMLAAEIVAGGAMAAIIGHVVVCQAL